MRHDFERYIRSRFDAAEVHTDPFPHMLIRDVLPLDLYAAIKRAQPTTDEWRAAASRERKKHKRRGRLRFWRTFDPGPMSVQFHVHPAEIPDDHFPSYSKPMHELTSDYISLLETCLHGKFKRQDWQSGQRVFFYRESGWAIEPHTHPAAELTNNLLYFPTDENISDQGTLFYRHKRGPADESEATAAFDPHDLEVVKIVPYTPNTLISWVNTPDSVHGSVEIAGAAARRYLYFVSLRAG